MNAIDADAGTHSKMLCFMYCFYLYIHLSIFFSPLKQLIVGRAKNDLIASVLFHATREIQTVNIKKRSFSLILIFNWIEKGKTCSHFKPASVK